MSEHSEELLRIEHLSVLFTLRKGTFKAVRNLNLQLDSGQIFALVGESGCGKSLTARSILKLPPPKANLQGQIFLRNIDLLALSEKELRQIRGHRISMIFQEPKAALNPVLTVGLQTAEPLFAHLGTTKQEAREQVEHLFSILGIPDAHNRYDSYPHELSGGMCQRVMIAMALICQPSLLLADEPTTALDVTIQRQILHLLFQQSKERKMAILLISHNLEAVAQIADVMGVMYAGSLVETASAQELFKRPLHPYTQGLLQSSPSRQPHGLKRLPSIQGTVPNLENIPQGCPFAPRCSYTKQHCLEDLPPLSQLAPNHSVACWKLQD